MESVFNLENKIAFVTGSTRGIGLAIAKKLASQGANVILNGLSDKHSITDLAKEIKDEFGVNAEGYLFDVGDELSVKDFYQQIFKKYKKLDVLVNNAGILDDNLIGMITSENIDRVLSTNIKGAILNLQYASRLMKRNKSGSIINISSIIGRFGNEGQVVYSSSKAALIGMTLSASKELASQNIRVNAIAPGFIETDMIKHLSPEKYQERILSIKMGKMGSPEDVANSALFLASDLSSYVTGQVLGVDGGMLI